MKPHFLYYNLHKSFWKRIFLRICVSKMITYLTGFYVKSFVSKIHIKKAVTRNNIDLNLFRKTTFSSYNDFFTRQYKNITFCKETSFFISPGEGKITILPINKDSIYSIKQVNYHLSDLLKNNTLPSLFMDGHFIILRLRPIDYHRYIFIDEGIQKKENFKKIKGKFHTVHPIAFKYFNVFCENTREYNILETKNFGTIIQIEIGALLVGRIHNHPITNFNKGQEKGFFSFGGSTIVLLVQKNKVIFDPIIMENSRNKIETKINLGEKIGFKINI
ncbi:phosphatidylserine decarboxylase [Candidatus Phytoplasma ziziphi]|uniref:Phosphatidylserine decarboxylase n=1 Tax=Ziziphus jujuba witches'-broom phytoplasma TaxID=135727 RepID=A0A660HLV5_ZIZJU|nr:phosphatidylserine decarboxylase [Candidatus Phytoplasma ziziphi]AYJ01031.1 phosphatidylserine decarboxylase [Candidatus Phytoplasma ziziphi]